MATPFWHKPKHTLYSALFVSLSLALAGCMGEDSKAKRGGDGTIVVNKIADITNESKANYDDNVNGLITHNTLKKWIDNWEANRPAGVSGKLVILQQGKGPAGAEFIKPNDKNVFTYVESGWLEPRNNGVMNIGEIVLSGSSIDRLIRKYGIDVNNDMIVCAQGGSAAGNYMNQGRCWFTFSYWGVPQQRIALLNGNNTYLSDSAQLGSTYFSPTASPIISRQISSVKDLKVDNTVLYASIEDVINVLPLTDAPYNGDGLLLWDARNLPQYSAGQYKWDGNTTNNNVVATVANGISGFQNSSTRQSHPRGALNLEFTNLLDVGTGLYHSKSTLKSMVRGGLSPKGEAFVSGESYAAVGEGNAYQDGDIAIHYCETSMRAGVTIVAAAVILGIPSRLYDSAMIEWNSLTAGAKDKRGFEILPSSSPWDTSVLSQPSPIIEGVTIAPRTAIGWAPEKTRQSITDAIFKKAETDKGAPLSTPEKQALTTRLAGLSDQDIQAEADAGNLSYQEFDATEIAKNLAASPMVTNAFAEKVNLIPLADQAYKAPKKVVEDDTESQGGGGVLPPQPCGG